MLNPLCMKPLSRVLERRQSEEEGRCVGVSSRVLDPVDNRKRQLYNTHQAPGYPSSLLFLGSSFPLFTCRFPDIHKPPGQAASSRSLQPLHLLCCPLWVVGILG